MTEEQETGAESPKIIVDDDWKSRVQEEKEALKEKAEDSEGDAEKKSAEEQPLELPPASFAFLVSTIATQAMAALGQLPDPTEEKPVVRKELAKLHIDTLAVIEEKTKGNLSVDESKMLDDVLHQLRMGYVGLG